MENLKLHGAKNIRDFGGLKNREGKTVKSGCFLRGNALNKLSKRDVRILTKQYRLGSVIDLRTAQEEREKPDAVIPGVRYSLIPIFSEATAGITREKDTTSLQMLDNCIEFVDLYAHMTRDEESRARLAEAFDLILNKPDGEALLWHCTQGKDRCGLVSALFLSLLDVEPEVILEDYLFTNTVPSPQEKMYAFLVRLLTRDEKRVEKVHRIYRADPAYLEAAFDGAAELFGSVDGFIRDGLGIDDEKKAAFKAKYLE